MVLTMLLLSFTSFAQDKEYFDEHCGTTELTDEQIEQLPWYNNNELVLNYLDSLEGNSNMKVERVFNGYKVLCRLGYIAEMTVQE